MRVNRVICLFGLLLFLPSFLFVQFDPAGFEAAAKRFVTVKVEEKVKARIDAQAADRLKAATLLLSRRMKERMAEAEDQMARHIPELVAAFVGMMCSGDCPQQEALEEETRQVWQERLERLHLGYDRVQALVQGRYREIMDGLRRDVRLFLLSNLILVSLATVLAFTKPQAALQLVPVTAVLLGANFAGATWYVFGQDWLLTILYGDYWGWSYLGLVSLLSLLLADIAFNRARVSTRLVNIGLNILGAALIPAC